MGHYLTWATRAEEPYANKGRNEVLALVITCWYDCGMILNDGLDDLGLWFG